MKTLIASISIALVLLAVTPAGAQETSEPVRQDLLRYVQVLQKLPPGVVAGWSDGQVDLAAAEKNVRDLTAPELAALGSAIDQMPYWNELLGALENARVVPRAEFGKPPAYSEFVAGVARTTLLSLMDVFAKIPGTTAPPGYMERVARTKAAINQLSGEQVIELHARVQAAAPQWRAHLESRASGEGAVQPQMGVWYPCSDSCEYDLLESVWCGITSTIDCIGQMALAVGTWVFDSGVAIISGIADFLGDIAADLLPSEEDFMEMIAEAGAFLAAVPENLRLPCMEDGSHFAFFGEVGTLPAAHKWERTVVFLGSAIEEALPDDVWSGNLKAAAAMINLVPQHILACFLDSYEARFAADQEEHRLLVDAWLDAAVSSRGSQVGVDGAQTATNDILGDVTNLEVKLDALGGKASAIDEIQARKRAFLGEFMDEALRLHIEVDLLRQASFRVGSFLLPESLGGHLETVAEIVAATLASRHAAGVDVKKAMADYAAGVQAYTNGNYKDAYGWYRKAYQRSVM